MIYTLELYQLPYKLDFGDILYVENRYDNNLNAFIVEHYDAICTHFSSRGYRFIYMPLHTMELFHENIVRYYAPYATCKYEIPHLGNDLILDYMRNPENRGKIKPSLVFYQPRYKYGGLQIEDYNYTEGGDFSGLLDIIERETNLTKYREGIIFRLIGRNYPINTAEPAPKPADETFSLESIQLMHEVEERIDKLRQMGISADILEHLLYKGEKLSRLLITKDFDIVLPDYHNLEIKMTPLCKAVYLLFLSHPEGIIFKYLPDYRQEISDIYSRLRDGNMTQRVFQSIEDVTDPFSNSINEKCARIREAFICQFHERLAKHYCIYGKRGEPKKIMLPQELIVWE